MRKIAEKLKEDLHTEVVVAGVEAVMASLGALTTPGTKLPLVILDMGGGSTDAAMVDESGRVHITHQAGAGELVSMLIQVELGLKDRHVAEQIKRYPLAKVESLFHVRMESGEIVFVEESIKMVASVNRSGGQAKLTVYPENGHDAWSDTYSNPEVFAWLLSHRNTNSAELVNPYRNVETYG